jgi:tripartite-type tricarboxylate transporter receptor subunit TctC
MWNSGKRRALSSLSRAALVASTLLMTMSVSAFVEQAKANQEERYPVGPVEWVIPFTPGSGADIFARTLSKLVEKNLGQQITAINKPGGSTSVGVHYVLSGPADGSRLFNNSSTLSLYLGHKLNTGDAPFKPADIQPVYRIDGLPVLLVVPSDSPFKTVQEFVDYAKANENKLKIGGAGRNSTQHFAALNFAEVSGTKFAWVPFNGGADSVVALLGHNLDGIFSTYDNVEQHLAAGTLKALAAASPERTVSPDIPTFKELGYPVVVLLWRGIFVKAGVPDNLVSALENAIARSLEDPEWTEFVTKFKLQPFYAKRAEFETFFNSEIEKARAYFKTEQ